MFQLILSVLLLNQNIDTNVTSVTVAFGSCNDPNHNTSLLPVLSNALDTADYMAWLGDNVYLKNGEWNSTARIKAKYNETFNRPEFQELLSKSRHIAVWDDHDAGPNDCDSEYDGLHRTMAAFKEFWSPSYFMPDTNSYYGMETVQEGKVAFFYLDNRTFKTTPDKENATLFGRGQLQWFEQAYRNSNAPVKIIMMGGQFLNTSKTFENVSNYPAERQRIIDIIAESEGQAIVLTGDRHHGEISALPLSNGRKLFDATASPLTAKSFAHHNEANTLRLHERTTEANHFGLLHILFENEVLSSLHVQLVDADQKVIFEHRETFAK